MKNRIVYCIFRLDLTHCHISREATKIRLAPQKKNSKVLAGHMQGLASLTGAYVLKSLRFFLLRAPSRLQNSYLFQDSSCAFGMSFRSLYPSCQQTVTQFNKLDSGTIRATRNTWEEVPFSCGHITLRCSPTSGKL